MAGYRAIAAAGKSIERLLTKRLLADEPVKTTPVTTTKAVLVNTDDFNLGEGSAIKTPPVLSIFLVRVEVNHVMRATWSGIGSIDGRAHLPLDLHFLLTPWAANAEFEMRILGSAMRCLEETPVLSGPLLDTTNDAQFAPDEAIQIVPGDLGPDGIMRIWDTLDVDYRLSVPYLVRIVRLDSDDVSAGPPVLTAAVGVTPSLDEP
jgi:hypothetical protein